MDWSEMGAGHFIFIPACLLIGMVFGWILGSRAAADHYRGELRKLEERAQRNGKRQPRPSGPRGEDAA